MAQLRSRLSFLLVACTLWFRHNAKKRHQQGTNPMYPLMLSASALLLTAGSAAAHTSAAAHSHTEMVIVAAGALVAVGAVLARRLVRSR